MSDLDDLVPDLRPDAFGKRLDGKTEVRGFLNKKKKRRSGKGTSIPRWRKSLIAHNANKARNHE